jgi:hypothetical protein
VNNNSVKTEDKQFIIGIRYANTAINLKLTS